MHTHTHTQADKFDWNIKKDDFFFCMYLVKVIKMCLTSQYDKLYIGASWFDEGQVDYVNLQLWQLCYVQINCQNGLNLGYMNY
jgi:hypothetical protein